MTELTPKLLRKICRETKQCASARYRMSDVAPPAWSLVGFGPAFVFISCSSLFLSLVGLASMPCPVRDVSTHAFSFICMRR